MTDPMNMTDANPATESVLKPKARYFLLAVAAYCATVFAYVGVRFTELASGVPAGAPHIALWAVFSMVLRAPLAAPALMPPQWPRPAMWMRRVCAAYTPFPILLALNALRYSLDAQQQGIELALAGIMIAVLALGGCIGALGVMLWPDLRRIARRIRNG